MVSYLGSCACQTVKLQLTAAPKTQSWCHCRDCQIHSGSYVRCSLLYPVTASPSGEQDLWKNTEGFKVLQGREAMTKHVYTSANNRYFCSKCGTPMFNHSHQRKTVSVSPLLFPDFPFEPQMHIFCTDTSRNLVPLFQVDGLPKHDKRPEGWP